MIRDWRAGGSTDRSSDGNWRLTTAIFAAADQVGVARTGWRRRKLARGIGDSAPHRARPRPRFDVSVGVELNWFRSFSHLPRRPNAVDVPPVTLPRRALPDLESLIGLFTADPAELGIFRLVEESELPPTCRRLLAHHSHMTVAVERHHGCPVDVQVLASRQDGEFYSRKILLSRRTDRKVVQFGIVRIDFGCVSPAVRAEIESQAKPMGHIMIEHNVLREVHLDRLWQVTLGPELAGDFQTALGTIAYGRTATIDFDGRPAMELLEIVAPEPPGDA